MKFKTTKTLLAVTVSALTASVAAAPYEVVNLGGLEGDSSIVYDINEAGLAVGYADGPENDEGQQEFGAHATLFTSPDNVDLGTLPDGTASQALGINDLDISVGYSDQIHETTNDNGDTVQVSEEFAVVFESGVVTKIPSITNYSQPKAFDINNNDYVILGGKLDVDPEDEFSIVDRGFIYDRLNDSFASVKPIADGANRRSFLTSINDNDIVTGFSDAPINEDQFTIKSFIVPTSDTANVTELPMIDERAIFSADINNYTEVVGSMLIPGTRGQQREAFYVDMSAANPELKLLGFFDPEFNDSRANDINNMGQIVGRALISSPTLGESSAFLYENDEMKNLNDLIACDSGWKLAEARSINDSGQIVGIGTVDGQIRAFRLDPTGGPIEDCSDAEPQPVDGGGSVPLTLLAILAALGVRRKYQVMS